MLTVYGLEQHEQWDSIVRTFKNYDVYWLSGYVKPFQIHGDGEPLLFYYEEDATRGMNVVMKRDVANDKHFRDQLDAGIYFDFSTPYGYGGWIVEGENTEDLFAAYEDWCQKNKIICEFARFHPLLENHKFSINSYEVLSLGNTVALDLSSPETIWANITSKNRNSIRKAQKSGVKIYHGRSPEIYKTFRSIYNETMDKDDADSYYYFAPEFYRSIHDDLPHNAQVFYAALEDKVISASIMLTANGRMSYHLSGSVREYAHLAPTNLLLYEAALWGCANGCKTLYLGGGVGSTEDGLFKFKKSFYRLDDLPRFHVGRHIFDPEGYKELISMRNDIPEASGYFPQYRA